MRYPSHVAVGTTPDVLWRVREPGINLAIWERPIIPESIRFIRELPMQFLPAGNFWCALMDFDGFLHTRFPALVRTTGGVALSQELKMLATLVTEISGQPDVDADLRVGNAAKSLGWHFDGGHLRLCVMGRGPGMQFVGEEDIVRERRDSSCWKEIRPDATIYEVPPGAVVALLGESWPGAESSLLLHRTPLGECSDRWTALVSAVDLSEYEDYV